MKTHKAALYLLLTITFCSVFVLFRFYYFSIYLISQNSMKSLLQNGDKVLVETYHSEPKIKIDEVLVFKHNGETYVKRCIAIPGDTILIIQGLIFINGKKTNSIKGLKVSTINGENSLEKIIKDNAILNDQAIFSAYHNNWTNENFGPFIVPKHGDKIKFDKTNKHIYKYLAELETNKTMSSDSFIFSKDYYFMVGDNRSFSVDSRAFGPIPSDQIIGKATRILFSTLNLMDASRYLLRIN